jgi:hypothetical protein
MSHVTVTRVVMTTHWGCERGRRRAHTSPAVLTAAPRLRRGNLVIRYCRKANPGAEMAVIIGNWAAAGQNVSTSGLTEHGQAVTL